MLDTVKKLCALSGVSGWEDEVRDYILERARPWAGETETDAKLAVISDGDAIDLLCDYYKYDGTYSDSFKMGDPITVKGALSVADMTIPSDMKVSAVYRFTDLFGQTYWTPEM